MARPGLSWKGVPHRTVPCRAVLGRAVTVSNRTVGSKPRVPPNSGPCNACQRGKNATSTRG